MSYEGDKYGVSILYLEPQYAITDKIGVGFRDEVYDSKSLYGLTGDYYLTTSIVRPSAGLILGLYDQRQSSYNERKNSDNEIEGRSYSSSRIKAVGISPRLKLNIGRAVLSYTYHFTPNDAADDFSALNLGYYLGGSRAKGKRDKAPSHHKKRAKEIRTSSHHKKRTKEILTSSHHKKRAKEILTLTHHKKRAKKRGSLSLLS